MSAKPISLFWNKVQLQCPDIPSLNFNPKIPMFGAFNLSLPSFFLTSFCYLGVFSATYFSLLWGYKGSISFYNRIKSFFNAKKYLDCNSNISHADFGG
jgi:hypothetical protein